MSILYLRADLFKADPEGPTITRYAGPTKQRKQEQMSPEQRVKPTKMAETPRTMGLAYMSRVGSATQRDPYKCVGEGKGFRGKGCGVTVHPGGMEHIEDVPGNPDPHRIMTALQQGAEYERKTKTGHLVEHPSKLEVTSETHPERQKELGPPGYVKHLTSKETGRDEPPVAAEHMDRKLCPDCHTRLTKKTTLASARGATPEAAKVKAEMKWSEAKGQAGLKRSLEILDEMLSKAQGEHSEATQRASKIVATNLAVHHSNPRPKTQESTWSAAKNSAGDAHPSLVRHYLATKLAGRGGFSQEQAQTAGKLTHARTGESLFVKSTKSDDWISDKISFLVKEEGKPQDQAVAIAHNMAGRSRKGLFLRSDLVKGSQSGTMWGKVEGARVGLGKFGLQGGPQMSRAEIKRQTHLHTPQRRESATQMKTGHAQLKDSHEQHAKNAQVLGQALHEQGSKEEAQQHFALQRVHTKAAREHERAGELAGHVAGSEKRPTEVSYNDLLTQSERAHWHTDNAAQTSHSADKVINRARQKKQRKEQIGVKQPGSKAARRSAPQSGDEPTRPTRQWAGERKPKAKQGKEQRVKPSWRKSLFLSSDLFKSDSTVFLRGDLAKSMYTHQDPMDPHKKLANFHGHLATEMKRHSVESDIRDSPSQQEDRAAIGHLAAAHAKAKEAHDHVVRTHGNLVAGRTSYGDLTRASKAADEASKNVQGASASVALTNPMAHDLHKQWHAGGVKANQLTPGKATQTIMSHGE